MNRIKLGTATETKESAMEDARECRGCHRYISRDSSLVSVRSDGVLDCRVPRFRRGHSLTPPGGE